MIERIPASATVVHDFDPTCPCGNIAAALLQAHPLDHCGGDGERADVDLLCKTCLTKAMAAIQETLLDAFLELRPAKCAGCDRDTVSLSDLIARIEPLALRRRSG